MDANPSGHFLYVILYATRERLEPLLLDALAPILRDASADPRLESLFFVRYSEPRWQLRVRVLDERDWVEGSVRARLAACVDTLTRDGAIEGHEFAAPLTATPRRRCRPRGAVG